MGTDFLNRFEREHDAPRFKALFDDTAQYIAAHSSEIESAFWCAIDSFCDEVIKKQEAKLLPDVAYISVSFLFTSFYFGTPKFQIDCYPEGWCVASESMYSTAFDAAWCTQYIGTFREDLIHDSKKDGTIRVIPAEKVEVYVLKAVRALLLYIVNVVKYFPQAHTSPKLFQMARSESFCLTFGELGDWQRVIDAILPEVDIFNCDKDTSLRFRRFSAVYFQDKEFSGLDLSHGTFRDCTFIDCKISECLWNDCIFDHCTFKRTFVGDSSLLGTTFFRCKMEYATFRNDTFNKALEEDDREVFRAAVMSHCSLMQTTFTDCDLTKCDLHKSDCDTVELIGGSTEGSLFSTFGKPSTLEWGV